MKSRLPEIPVQQMTPEQTRILDDIQNSPRGNLSGPFLAWIHSPELAEAAQKLGAHCRYGTGLAPRLTELAILQTAVQWQCQGEWLIHQPIARDAGLSEAVIARIKQGQAAEFDQSDEALVYRIGEALYHHRRVDQELYQQGIQMFGAIGMVELVGVFGYYALVAMTLNAFEMRPEGEPTLPFPER